MLLYPRLSPAIGRKLAEERSSLSLTELEELSAVEHPRVTVAPTGGVKATSKQLLTLQEKLRRVAERHGYTRGLDGQPLPLDRRNKAPFDAALAVAMHQEMRISASEAARPGVWAFLGVILLPELVRWRFPGAKTTEERFLGNRLRNMYGRVWWRAELLRDDQEDSYWLLRELGEDELVQITERPNAAGYRDLALGIAKGLVRRWNPGLGLPRTQLLREAMKRLLRLLPLIRFEALSTGEVESEIDALYDETLRGLGIEFQESRPVQSIIWDREARWQDLSLARRTTYLKALGDDDIARLTSLQDERLPDWGEYKSRWKALFRIDGTAEQVIRLAPEPKNLPRGDELGVWLTAEAAGSWQSQVDAARGRRFLGSLRQEDLRELYRAIDWDWPDGLTHSGSQRYLRRRYSGSWEALLEALSEEALRHVCRLFPVDPAGSISMLRQGLARWLLVQPDLEWGDGEDDISAIEPVPASPPRPMELPEPPSLIQALLDRLEVRDSTALLALDLEEVRSIRGVGDKKVRALRASQQEVGAAKTTVPERPTPKVTTLDALLGQILSELNEREATAVGLRFERGATLAEIGSSLDLSRERVRQIIKTAIRRRAEEHGDEARELLQAACPGTNGRAYALKDLGIEEWQGLLLATVAHEGNWLAASGLLWNGSPSDLAMVKKDLSQQLAGLRLENSELERLAGELSESPGTIELILVVLMGWVRRPAGWLELPEAELSREEWLLKRLRANGPTHQSEVGRWLMEREGLTPDEMEGRALSYTRRAEGVLSRLDHAWRWARGTFIHTSALPVSPAGLNKMIAWCVERVSGTTGPYGVDNLLQELVEAGFEAGALNRYVLKDALARHEDILPLRKGNVACAHSYSEQGVGLADRVLAVLEEGERPMSAEEVVAELPSTLAFSEVSVQQLLYTHPGVQSAGRGLFQIDRIK